MDRAQQPPPEDSRRWGMPTILAILLVILIVVCVVCCGAYKHMFPGAPLA